MKVICDRAALVEAMDVVGGVVAQRTPTPVLQCIKLTATDGLLRVAATDLEVGLHMSVEQVDVVSEGDSLIPADKLRQIVRASDDSTLTLETEGHKMHIRGEDAHFVVYGFDPAEAPTIRGMDDAPVDCEVTARAAQLLIHRTLFAAATEHSRYAINGVLFDRAKKKIRMVATDGRRLALARGDCLSIGEVEAVQCIIPTKALTLINKLITDPDATIRIAIDGTQIIFGIGDGENGAVLVSNLREGAFPPFEDVIPKDQDKRVTFNPGSLSNAIRRAALLTNDESKGVRMNFADNRLTLTSRAPELGEAEVQVDLESYEGDPLEIGFNPGFIVDALKVVDGGPVMIELKASNKPGVIRTGNDFTYVVMPVNLS
ncbi:MAG: DNA polymerase III subunit beta [Planctomycetota bacterium]|jgi:DNA polymerase-3 subunit beta